MLPGFARESAAKYLQPAGNFVKRPPLNWKIAGPLCFIASCAGILFTVLILIRTREAAHATVQKHLIPCEFPKGSTRCTEKTVYPKHLSIPLNQWISMEVILRGPSYLSKSQMEEAIRGMSCRFLSNDGNPNGSLVYSPGAALVPEDFRRSCTNPLMPGIVLRTADAKLEAFSPILDRLKRLKSLKGSMLPSIDADFELEEIMVQRVQWKEFGWLGIAYCGLVFEDGRRYDVGHVRACDGSFLSADFNRDCGLGSPYLRNGSRTFSRDFPDICPLNASSGVVFGKALFEELIRDPSWIGWYVGKGKEKFGAMSEQTSVMEELSNDICAGGHTTIADFLGWLEGKSPEIHRGSDELIKHLSLTIEEQCPYSFECDDQEFQGESIWLAISYPILIIVAKVFSFVLQRAYVVLHKLLGNVGEPQSRADATARPQDVHDSTQCRSPQANFHVSPSTQQTCTTFDDTVEAVNVALIHLLQGVDVTILRNIPEIIHNMEQRLSNIETHLKCLQSLEVSTRHTDTTFQIKRTEPADLLNEPLSWPQSPQQERLHGQPSWLSEVEYLKQELQQSWRKELDLAMHSCTKMIALENTSAGQTLRPEGRSQQQSAARVGYPIHPNVHTSGNHITSNRFSSVPESRQSSQPKPSEDSQHGLKDVPARFQYPCQI